MSFEGVSFWPVVAAAVAGFLFGGVWYGVLSKQWLAAANLSEAEIRGSGLDPTPFVISFVALTVMAIGLSALIRSTGDVDIGRGLTCGAIVWAAFVVTTLAVNHAFQGQKRTLTLIDAGHWLGVLIVQGTVIGWLG